MVQKSLIFIAMLLILPVVSAMTPITVETLQNHDVSLIIIESDKTYYALETLTANSGSEGKAKFDSTVDKSKIDIFITVKKDGVKIISERKNGIPTGQEVTFKLYPPGFEPKEETLPAINDSQNTTEPIANESNFTITEQSISGQTNKTALTGFALGNLTKNIPAFVYYIIGGLIIVALLAMLIIKGILPMPKRGDMALNYKPIRLSNQDTIREIDSSELKKAESKLYELQAEINRIKNKEKITAAEKRVQDAKAELERLKRGED